MAVKKLIEVALPLDAINSAAAREKSIRHGHPSTMHLWWARRPLATARAVIWASLVDDPSSHLDRFPTTEEQDKERQRLFRILEDLVIWENSNNSTLLDNARREIEASNPGGLPPLLDPFAGGGAIPLEAQRLGLDAYAQDLNPVAVTINKAMIEIPPLFEDNPPVNPNARTARIGSMWSGNDGLISDIDYYGHMLKRKAFERIGHLYPTVELPPEYGGGQATVIAWLWSRIVECPNPACKGEAPLARTFDLAKKKGKERHVRPIATDGKIAFTVQAGKSPIDGTVNRKGAKCFHCGSTIDFPYIRNEGRSHRMGQKLMAIVLEGPHGRIYLPPDQVNTDIADVPRPEDYPDAQIANNPRDFKTPNYGLEYMSDLFTNRQLQMLTTFCDLLDDIEDEVYSDALAAGMKGEASLPDLGTGPRAYAQAVRVYLSFVIDKLLDRNSSICGWANGAKYEIIRNVFARQAIAMNWDYAEANPFSSSSGCFDSCMEWITRCLAEFPRGARVGHARQFDAQSDNEMRGIIVSTDPPYYDNIGYADLSDFFYIWLRQSLKSVYPGLFRTMLVPKHEELVATPYRENRGIDGARTFFEEGMYSAFKQVNRYACDDVPVTIYYAFKQSETTTENEVETTASTGWETMLSAVIRAGFAITGTWPMRTEMSNRTIASGTNALASSIVLVCRKRPDDAPMATRRDFVNTLKRELKPALDKLQTSNIAPVDMAQSAIGPGIGVYSRFSKVLEADGSEMTVRAALQIINQELDLYFSDQDSDLDRDSRFCVDLYTQSAFNEIKFGEADVLARAKNTSIDGLAAKGALYASKGIVRLLGRDELKNANDWQFTWLFTQQLTHAMETGGVEACAQMLKDVFDSRAENAKALAYRLFTIADKKGWNAEAFAYNSLVVAWPEIQSRAAQLQAEKPVQYTLFDD